MEEYMMKTKSPQLNEIWKDLVSIFNEYHSMSCRTIERLTALGFNVNKGSTHSKIYMPVGIMIVSNTPSDYQAGRQILRQIRRMYEQAGV